MTAIQWFFYEMYIRIYGGIRVINTELKNFVGDITANGRRTGDIRLI